MAARFGEWVIWYEDIHEAFEMDCMDESGVLRPQSFGMFDLSHILHILLQDGKAIAHLWEGHQELAFPPGDSIDSDLLASLVGLDLAVAGLVETCAGSKGKLDVESHKLLHGLWQECCDSKKEYEHTTGADYLAKLELLARVASITSSPDLANK
jgi:hypothetical protein